VTLFIRLLSNFHLFVTQKAFCDLCVVTKEKGKRRSFEFFINLFIVTASNKVTNGHNWKLGSKGLCDIPYNKIQKAAQNSFKRPLLRHFLWEIIKAPATSIAFPLWPVRLCICDLHIVTVFVLVIECK
jgi:hypothetical protein